MKGSAVVKGLLCVLLAPWLVASGSFTVSAADLVAAPGVAAESWMLMDYESGEVLAQGNADARIDPASLVKIMSSYVIGEALQSGALSASDRVTIEHDAWAAGNPHLQGSSLMFLKPGDRVSVQDLNAGVVVQSGNDACIALATYIAGSENAFIDLMNEQAGKLGLTNTQFKTVHGLAAEGQYSSARDMAILSRALIAELPAEYALYKQKAFAFNNVQQYNRNRLLWSTSLDVDGLKTGNSSAGGYSLVTSAQRDGRRLIAVVMGAKSDRLRFQESEKLLKWGFRAFETVTPIQADEVFMSKRVWFGQTRNVKLNAGAQATISVPYGHSAEVQASAIVDTAELHAPLQAGQVVGVVNFQVGSKHVASKPLVVMESVEEGGWFSRAWDYLLLKVYQWLGVCLLCAG
ncbi:penicillin-binding protein 6. Serine peptidase. MEROPS family S11 [Pseudomonas sp. UC 17F4]|uniref:serine hydrolase n=1 Tax=Pseudomonas sp. UC 17F4 TaxID=1855328 RepID=UPI000889CA58|nr:penicillin-binding protein 6. Serine peptidase. MEROPS family S11 [Pseudomonas sp. UC 17F4]